jgi:hypothetical protein
MNPSQMPSKDDVHRELDEIAPQLSNMKHEDGFNVPHNYFKTLPDQVIQRIAGHQETTPVWQVWWGRLVQPRFALVLAGVAVLIVATFWLAGPKPQTDLFASITEEEALQYVIANLHEYSTEEVMMVSADQTWDADELIRMSDENMDELIDEIIESGDEIYIEDLF